MSKILELLHYHKKREEAKKEKLEDFSNHVEPGNFDSGTKEKLASTYIFNPPPASERVIKRQDRDAAHQHNLGHSGVRFAQLFPWLISFLAILLLLVNMAYRGKVNIVIEVLNENAEQAALPLPNLSRNKELVSEIKSVDIAPISTNLITEGQLNSYIVKNLGFYGAAISRSRILQDGLYLVNDGTAGWASAGIDLARPMDFSGATLDFFIKGAKGKESLKLILRDSENNSYMPQAYNIIFNKNMGTDWQFVSVPFRSFDGAYNPKKIKHIGFEFGTQTTSNKAGSSLHIKNIKIVENEASR